MAFRIRKNAAVTISAQAVAGGTLVADTTYYVVAIFNQTTAFRDGDGHSDFTNEVSVLTTSVNRSIQINYSYTVNILSFSDAGGGQVWVQTDGLHCLLANDNITIAGTTNYDGDYLVTFNEYADDPDTFKITATWVSDDATGTVTDDTDDVIGANYYISLHCYTTPSWDGSEWIQAILSSNQWIGPGYSAPPAVQGYTITSPPTGSGSYGGSVMPYWRRDGFPKSITSYDRPYIEVLTYESWNDIIAYMTTWLPTNSNLSLGNAQQIERLYFVGHLRWKSLTTLISITNKDVTIDGASYDTSIANGQEYIQWKYCLYKQIGVRRPQIAGTFTECVIRSECQDGPQMTSVVVQDCMLLPSSNYTFYGTNSTQIDGGTIQFNSKSRYFWFVYPDVEIPQTRIKNLNIREGYLYLYLPYHDAIIAEDTHYLENLNIYTPNTTRDIYIYQPSGDRQIEALNVRAPDQTNGICRILRHATYPLNDDIYFYFSVALRVVDSNGIAIVGATVKMTDKDSNEVSDITDVNGDVSINVKSYQNLATAGDEYGTYTDFNPFVLTVEKDGYQTSTESNMDFYDKIEKTVAMIDEVPPVYYQKSIDGSVSTNDVEGEVSQADVAGSVSDDNVEGAAVKGKTVTGSVTSISVAGSV